MSKKDYVEVAKLLNTLKKKDLTDLPTLDDVATGLVGIFVADNPAFDTEKFKAAVNKE